jgi:hypothetical protein
MPSYLASQRQILLWILVQLNLWNTFPYYSYRPFLRWILGLELNNPPSQSSSSCLAIYGLQRTIAVNGKLLLRPEPGDSVGLGYRVDCKRKIVVRYEKRCLRDLHPACRITERRRAVSEDGDEVQCLSRG